MSNSDNNSDTSAQHLIDSVINLYLDNNPTAEIAKMLNISVGTVYNYLKKQGIKRTRRLTTSTEQKNEVYRLYLQGLKLIEISNLVNINRNLVSKILKSYGINPNSNYQRHINQIEDNKVDLFLDLQNPNTQYWLGFLAADGCIKKNNTTISFTTKDYDLAHAFCNYANVSPGNKIYTYFDKRYNLTYYQVELNHKKSCLSLIQYGITPRKTFSLSLKIPITHNFMAGLLDGDGSVSKNDLSWITASESFKDQICSFLRTYNYYVIRFNKKNNKCKEFVSLMYKDLDFYLKRKYDLVMTEFKNW